MSDSVQVTPSKSESQFADSPGSSVAQGEDSSAPTSPAQPSKRKEPAKKVDQATSGAELSGKDGVQDWSRAHEWFYGQVGGLFKHYGGKNWNQLLFDLERIQAQVSYTVIGSIPNHG